MRPKFRSGHSFHQKRRQSVAAVIKEARGRSTEAHLAADAAHVWHPYSSASRKSQVWPVVSASGVRLKLETGEEVIDGMSSWWAAVHGYNHPVLNSAVRQQLDQCAHVMFGGLTHRPAVALCETLVHLAPGKDLSRVFLCDSGSVSIEVGIKLALQFWQAQGPSGKKKTKFIALRGGYHGDTFGAMAVCDPVNGMHAQLFSAALPKNIFAPRPQARFQNTSLFDASAHNHHQQKEEAIAALEKLIADRASEVAAFIFEPIVQGAGGMWFYDPEVLRRAQIACRKHDVLLIADEIATGFGRTGTHLFASQHAGLEPDILCVGKALTGGYLSMAACLATDRVALADNTNVPPLMHGPTFMANPLCAAVALASLDLLTSPEYNWVERVANIERSLFSGLASCTDHPAVADVRVLGAIGVIELKSPDHNHTQIANSLIKRGVWLRSFRNLIYTMPPFIIDQSDLNHLTDAISSVVNELPPSPDGE